jgi:large subunit ribosomal protein L19
MNNLLAVASPQVADKTVPEIASGDTVRVQVMIVEGDRERLQPFQGVVIRRYKAGMGPTITVRRIASHGIGVERSFPLLSPRVAEIEVIRHANVHRKQLYFLRDRVGKQARLR